MENIDFDEKPGPAYKLTADLLNRSSITPLNRAVTLKLFRNYFIGSASKLRINFL